MHEGMRLWGALVFFWTLCLSHHEFTAVTQLSYERWMLPDGPWLTPLSSRRMLCWSFLCSVSVSEFAHSGVID